MQVIYLAHPRYSGLTFLPYFNDWRDELPPSGVYGCSTSVWFVPGTVSCE